MIDDESSRFTLAELVEASGVPERTIRFYITNSLVSPALGKGRARYYTPRHLAELEWVASRRAKRFSIEEIREQITADADPEHDAPGETWQRICLHPGLELAIRSDAPEGVQALARELREVARRWFGGDSA